MNLSLSNHIRKVTRNSRQQSQLYFFGRNKKDDEKKEDDGDEEDQKPFFSRFLERAMSPPAEETPKAATNEAVEAKPAQKEPTAVAHVKKVEPKKDMSATEKAHALKAQAERMRLEAERMDAQLTLDKIERLERELAQAKKKGDSVEELQAEMEALQAKMRGEAPKPKVSVVSVPGPAPKTETTPAAEVSTSTAGAKTTLTITDEQPLDEKKFLQYLKNYKDAPEPMKIITAATVGMYSPDVDDINATEVALRMEMLERSDFSFLKDVPKLMISEKNIEEVKKDPLFRVRMMAEKEPEDVVARNLLNDQYYAEMISRQVHEAMEENPFFEIELRNLSETDQITESLFPKACRKDGETPTLAQATTLANEVLPKAGFNPTGKPEPVEGGYIIRGTNKMDSADGLVESIDTALAKSPIRGKLSVFFIKDYTIFTEQQLDSSDFSFGNSDPILLVTGPNVYREPRRLLFSAVSAMGIASSWYLSIYPFLLNPDLMKRAEEQMSLADANMAYDLTWLTDLSLPLFLTFMGIQLTHEIGHRVAAAAYGVSSCGRVCM